MTFVRNPWNDLSIADWRPEKSGEIDRIRPPFASTKIEKIIGDGFKSFKKVIPPYSIELNGSMYQVKLKRTLNQSQDFEELETAILVEGGISIYQYKRLPGTSLKGNELLLTGKLWFAKNKKLLSTKQPNPNLDYLVFENSVSPRQVRKILKAFSQQESQKQASYLRAALNSYSSGVQDGEARERGESV